ncbi:MAG: hypothetical protein R3304_13350 [Longimicrobiales bacterium]|nr:hypothetical protein [Longimicrobiales bacterium]
MTRTAQLLFVTVISGFFAVGFFPVDHRGETRRARRRASDDETSGYGDGHDTRRR